MRTGPGVETLYFLFLSDEGNTWTQRIDFSSAISLPKGVRQGGGDSSPISKAQEFGVGRAEESPLQLPLSGAPHVATHGQL